MQRLRGRFHPLARDAFAEEHHVRLHDAAAARARRHVETGEILAVQVRVAVGGDRGIEVLPGRVAFDQLLLECVARQTPVAGHAAHFIEPSVQVDHAFAAGTLVQAVDVLGDQQFDMPAVFQLCQGKVRGVRARLAEVRPADQAARPVALARGVFVHESLQRHRRCALPLAFTVAVVRNAGVGADPRAGQHEQSRVGLDEMLQRSHVWQAG